MTIKCLLEPLQQGAIGTVKVLGFSVAIGIGLDAICTGVVSHWPHSKGVEWDGGTHIGIVMGIHLHQPVLAYNLLKLEEVVQVYR